MRGDNQLAKIGSVTQSNITLRPQTDDSDAMNQTLNQFRFSRKTQ
jgi:hypothetical protein